MQVGTTEDQGLYTKPSATVHPGALAAGTLPQYNTIRVCMSSEEMRSEGHVEIGVQYLWGNNFGNYVQHSLLPLCYFSYVYCC